MSNPVVTVTEEDGNFYVSLQKVDHGWRLRFTLEEIQAFNDATTSFLNERAVEDLSDFSLDDDDCEGCKI